MNSTAPCSLLSTSARITFTCPHDCFLRGPCGHPCGHPCGDVSEMSTMSCRQGGRAEARRGMSVAGYGVGWARVAAAADVLAAAVLRGHIGKVLRAVLDRPVLLFRKEFRLVHVPCGNTRRHGRQIAAAGRQQSRTGFCSAKQNEASCHTVECRDPHTPRAGRPG